MGSTKTQMMIGDRYVLNEQLGKGGFGVVYKADDTLLNRPVAIKLLKLPTSGTDAERESVRKRFVHEATTAGRISHPNVVAIYDMGLPTDASEHAFIVMEYLEGKSLYVHLRTEDKLPFREALELYRSLLVGVGKGHELGVIHKDIKPGNIFVRDPSSSHRSLCLLDFGVARLLHEQKMTTTGMLVGTPHYMAPEYISNNEVSPALDVYQLGLILVELLGSGPAVPHAESFMQCCNRHFSGRLEIPVWLMDGPIGPILKRALATQPKHRFQNATEFADAISEILNDSELELASRRDTKSITAVFTDNWINPFDQTSQGLIPTMEELPAIAEPESSEVDPFAFTQIDFTGPSTSGKHIPSTEELSRNTYSGRTQKAFTKTKPHEPLTRVYETEKGRTVSIVVLLVILVLVIAGVFYIAFFG